MRWLIPYLSVVVAFAASASCTFRPAELAGSPGPDGGASPDASEVAPDARGLDAAIVPEDAAVPDASPDAGDELTRGLLAHWPLDRFEGPSDELTPDVAGGFDGEVVGSPTIVVGAVGNALSLDGTSEFVRIDDAPELDFSGVITMAAWCRPRSIVKFQSILTHGTSFGPNGELYLRIEAQAYQGGSWNGGDHRAVSPMPAEDIGQWVHLATVYDGATWRLYRNGVEVDTGGNIGAVTVNEDWAIGARNSDVDRHFEGDIDDVRIYGRALLPEEIEALVALREQ